jgi:hypothetical protein
MLISIAVFIFQRPLPLRTSRLPSWDFALQSPASQCVTPTCTGCLLASVLFLDNQNDLFVGKSCLHLSVLLLGGLYTKLGGFYGRRSAPVHLIKGGLPAEGTLAHVGVSKYADHCPLFRQSQI